MHKYVKEILRRELVFLIGLFLIGISILLIVASSYSERIVFSGSREISLDRESLYTIEDMIDESRVSETINGSLAILNMCNESLRIDIYRGSNYTEYLIPPHEEVYVENISLETLLRIYPVGNCSSKLTMRIEYLVYPYAYLNFAAFILVAAGSIMIFRHLLMRAREISVRRESS